MNSNQKIPHLTFSKLQLLLIQHDNLFYKRLLYVLFTNRCKISNFDNNGKLKDLKNMSYTFKDLKFQQIIFKYFCNHKEIVESFRDDIFLGKYIKKYELNFYIVAD